MSKDVPGDMSLAGLDCSVWYRGQPPTVPSVGRTVTGVAVAHSGDDVRAVVHLAIWPGNAEMPGASLHLNRPPEFFQCLLVKRSRLGFRPVMPVPLHRGCGGSE